MWNIIILPLLILPSLTTAGRLDPVLAPFSEPLLEDQFLSNNATRPNFELVKRQNTGCASGWSNCAQLGVAGLCCQNTAICQSDSAGNVACCPSGAVCTGTIKPVSAATGSTSFSTVTGAGLATTSTTTTAGGAGVTVGTNPTTTSGGIVFVQASGGTTTAASSAAGRSYVPNPYYPYAFIPTTYANAAACSTAYTTCHSDFASCTAYLAGGAGAHGVTVSVSGGGGTTVAVTAAPTTYPGALASSVCASLSSSACYGLVVEACASFGAGSQNWANPARCTGIGYAAGVGAGVAIGLAGLR